MKKIVAVIVLMFALFACNHPTEQTKTQNDTIQKDSIVKVDSVVKN